MTEFVEVRKKEEGLRRRQGSMHTRAFKEFETVKQTVTRWAVAAFGTCRQASAIARRPSPTTRPIASGCSVADFGGFASAASASAPTLLN